MAINTDYTSNIYSSLSSLQNSQIYSGSGSASEASYRTKTKNAIAAEASSQSGQSFLVSAKTGAKDLNSALASILGSGKSGVSSINAITAVSDNKDALTIKSVDSKKATSAASTTVQIDQIAMSQKNTGTAMTAKAATGISSGAGQMSLTVGDKAYTVDYNISATDTNQQAQQKIADAINKKNVGVKASVSVGKDGKSTLSLESTATGVTAAGKDNFSVRDVRGNAVSSTGINKVTQAAQDAKYSVNGGASKTSKSNEVDIGNGVTATLKSATGDGVVTVSKGKDASGAINDVKNMVSSFNSLLKAAADNKKDSKTNTLFNQLSGLSKSYKDSLGRIGVSVSSDGSLKIDEDKLKKSAEVGEYAETSDLEKFFLADKGASYGFANRLANISKNVSSNVNSYVSNSSSSGPALTAKQSAQYNQYLGMGLLFDMMA